MRIGYETVVDPPYVQSHPGQPLPHIRMSIQGKQMTRSISAMDDMEQHVRSEKLDTGEPVSHGTTSMVLADNQLMSIQFQEAGIPAGAQIGDVTLTLEMFGTEWLGLEDTVQQLANFTVIIQAHASAVSADLRYDENDISTRQLTDTKVYWSVPKQMDHAIIATPNIGAIFNELQTQDGWTERSSITIVLSPADPINSEEPHAYRIFKSLKTTNVSIHHTYCGSATYCS